MAVQMEDIPKCLFTHTEPQRQQNKATLTKNSTSSVNVSSSLALRHSSKFEPTHYYPVPPAQTQFAVGFWPCGKSEKSVWLANTPWSWVESNHQLSICRWARLSLSVAASPNFNRTCFVVFCEWSVFFWQLFCWTTEKWYMGFAMVSIFSAK